MDVGLVFASQIKKLRKRFCCMEPAPIRSVLTFTFLLNKFYIHWHFLMKTLLHWKNILLKKFKLSQSARWKINCTSERREKNNLDVEPLFASQIRKLRKGFCWVEQTPFRSVLTPISCTKLKIHSAHFRRSFFLNKFYIHWDFLMKTLLHWKNILLKKF